MAAPLDRYCCSFADYLALGVPSNSRGTPVSGRSPWVRLSPLVLAVGLGAAATALRASPIVDGHTHQGLSIEEGILSTRGLAGLGRRGFEVILHAMPVDRSPTGDVLRRIEAEVAWLQDEARRDEGFYLAEDPAALLGTAARKGIGLVFGVEWSGALLEGDLSRVRRLRRLGVRSIGLADDDPDGLFRTGEVRNELSPFGLQVVAALNDAAVLIDLTHLAHERKLAIIAASRRPTVVSHGNARAAADLRFNLPDVVVDALAASGGHVWVSFNRNGVLGVGEDEARGLERLLDHIDALVARLGPRQVGIGTDLQVEGRYVPEPLNQDRALEAIRTGLAGRGYTAAELDDLMGNNVLRALAGAGD